VGSTEVLVTDKMRLLRNMLHKSSFGDAKSSGNDCIFDCLETISLKNGLLFEIVVLGFIAIPTSYFMLKNDIFDKVYLFTRAHEDWELDEWFCVFFALLFAFFILAQLRLYAIIKVHNKLQEVSQKLIEKERKECRHKRMIVLGSVASGLAHEVNNAIQPIIGLGEFIREEFSESGNDKYLAYMNTIMNGAYHANGVLENILQLSHEKTLFFRRLLGKVDSSSYFQFLYRCDA
jgi:signal transduction histidine kinase